MKSTDFQLSNHVLRSQSSSFVHVYVNSARSRSDVQTLESPTRFGFSVPEILGLYILSYYSHSEKLFSLCRT
jgi:hypothetical protein